MRAAPMQTRRANADLGPLRQRRRTTTRDDLADGHDHRVRLGRAAVIR